MTMPVPTFLSELALARRAFEWAAGLHADQRRDSDGAAFILHPLEVASLLHNTGHDETVVAAGILHDAVESTDADVAQVRGLFGDAVAALVDALTENPTIEDFGERKARLRRQVAQFGPQATAIYAADKVAKVRELRARAAGDPSLLDTHAPTGAKLAHYIDSLAMLEDRTPDHPLVRQLRFELEALRALPPHPPP